MESLDVIEEEGGLGAPGREDGLDGLQHVDDLGVEDVLDDPIKIIMLKKYVII